MRHTVNFLFIISSVFFMGCSWQEDFVISNTSSSPITIEYHLQNFSHGFAIFEDMPMVYGLNASGTINWEKPLSIADTDTTLLSVKVVVPANSSLVFGHLSNDHYTSYNQYFINDRNFNLKQIRIINHEKIIEIVPQTFDTFFKKEKGEIILTIN